uniref:Cytochrome b n=1 Tax=Syphacia obvelata TaxID=412127 RepID=A0A0U2KUC3_SYPOB|nr:cytochrome b [Syphacia obvelata]
MIKKFLEFVVYLPTSKTLSYWWNFGSILGMLFGVQLLTGVLLVFYYGTDMNFDSVQYIMYDVNWGWLMRVLHFNGASFFFVFMYFHVFKGFFYGSYRMVLVWMVGVVMMLVFMGVGFMGYVLVNAQMSYWAAVVITSLMTVIPWFGVNLVYFIWGGYSVVSLTIKFFFVLHFFALVLVILIMYPYCFCIMLEVVLYYFVLVIVMSFLFFLIIDWSICYVFYLLFFCVYLVVLCLLFWVMSKCLLSLMYYLVLFMLLLNGISCLCMLFCVLYLGNCLVFYLYFLVLFIWVFWYYMKGVSVNKFKFTGVVYVLVFVLTWLGANAPEMPFLVLSPEFYCVLFFYCYCKGYDYNVIWGCFYMRV